MEMPDISCQMRNVRQVSGIISGIKFVYAGAIYMAGIDYLYQFLMNLSTKMVCDGNAGYCIPDARFETIFGIFSGIDSIYSGEISVPEMQ